MSHAEPAPAAIVRQSAEIARQLAYTARLHREPEEARRFEQIAAEADERAARLAELEARYP